MTIATIMSTCLVFIAIGWTGKVYEPMALVVGAMICIAGRECRRYLTGFKDRLYYRGHA